MQWISSNKKVPGHLQKVLVKYVGGIRMATHNVKDSTFRFENGSSVSLKTNEVFWAEVNKPAPAVNQDGEADTPADS